MNATTKTTTIFFPSLEAATKSAEANNALEHDDPEGWRYLPMALPDGRAKVMIMDEYDLFVGYLYLTAP
jgi:hypothetical protein